MGLLDTSSWLKYYFLAMFYPDIVVQSLSCLTVTPWTAARQASLFFTISQSLLKLMSIESMMPSNHLILCLPLLSCPQSFPALGSLCIRWSKYWSFSVSPSNEYSGLISFRTDWFVLLAVQGTLQESSLAPQFESINFSVLSLHYDTTLTSPHDY